jgi:hypothetical protein
MKWTCCISRIDRIWETYPTLLPRCAFILTDGTTVKKLSGWLPCHHANISYTLEINDNNIQRILDIAKKDKRKDEQVIRSTNTRFKKDKKEHFNQYITLANKAYTSKSLWILSIIYPLWKLKTLDIEDTYNNLLANIMQICDRESRLSLSKLWYDKILSENILKNVERMAGLNIVWAEFNANMDIQCQLRTDTGIKRPPKIRKNVQKYKGLWTTNAEIQRTRIITKTFRPDNVKLQLGSPCPSHIPSDAICLCVHDEDIFRWHCFVEWGTMYSIQNCPLLQNKTIYIGFAHHWGVEQWSMLASKTTGCSFVCIGRLDQYPRGRGQIFRDMYESVKFRHMPVFHQATDNVKMVNTEDVEHFIQEIQQTPIPIQCFSNEPSNWKNINVGRVWYMGKIRTIRTLNGCNTFYEEKCTNPHGKNASVMKIQSYRGLPVPISIYICSEKTTAFHIHVARTFTQHLLYIVNCSTCLFSFEQKAPSRITINPFTS